MKTQYKHIEKLVADEWAYQPEETVEIRALDLCKLYKQYEFATRELKRMQEQNDLLRCLVKPTRTIITF